MLAAVPMGDVRTQVVRLATIFGKSSVFKKFLPIAQASANGADADGVGPSG